ncbi:hypothetical protein ACHAWF_013929 [Thalassiosira exigua]
MIQRLVASRCIRPLVGSTGATTARCVGRNAGAAALIPKGLLRPSPTIGSTHHGHCPRRFSSSHDDFSPQKKHNLDESDGEPTVRDLIDSHVKGNRVMLYMKGSPAQPMCGFSATVVQILKSSGTDFASVNVLDYPEVREGVKKYAQWPTIPQLYVDGEFVGGCDIIKDLHESGELKDLLKVEESSKNEGG